ncbi:MAG: pyruvate carboxylase, partial [Proteobacteria bacterium]|nr:pyruvate carboxylase [Pseudomonadota bacterium]
EYVIGGVKTTIPLHRQILKQREFLDSQYDTRFVDTHKDELLQYWDEGRDSFKLCRLMAQISAKGYNEFVQLGEYRGRADKRLGRFNFIKPAITETDFQPRITRGMDRTAILDALREDREKGIIQLTDTTTRDITQSNSGNRFRLAEDRLVGPYLDKCGFFSLENGGGAHFHVAMLANMTYPFTEAKEWNQFAPDTLKQILIRSTNVLGYKPQPKNVMRLTGEMICDHYEIIRCFDFLNHVENMRPFAEVALSSKMNIFEPALSMSWAKGFDVDYYMNVTQEILEMCADVAGVSKKKVSKMVILGLKDMAGVCPPRFMRELVTKLRTTYPELVLHYHRHYTDGLFVPSCGAAAEAGAHILDVAIGSTVRWYGQGDVLSTAAYLEGELGLTTHIDKEAIRATNFACKQIMPYYDRYVSPYFQGIDYDVVEHGMPGGATSSSQEGAMKQGYIHLLPHMLKYLSFARKIVRYHDVTPGSQITWNQSFLNVVGAFKRGGEDEVRRLLSIMENVTTVEESALSGQEKAARLDIYRDSNDAFRDLLLGKFGKLPLGWPADWVYESAFGAEWEKAKELRVEDSPLLTLQDVDFEAERAALHEQIGREPSKEEFVLYLNHPADAIKTIKQKMEFGNANNMPIDVWFEGARKGEEVLFTGDCGKPHRFEILDIPEPDGNGISDIRYIYDHERLQHQVKLSEAKAGGKKNLAMADPNNLDHIGSPSTGDLWITYFKAGDIVKKGQEIFNISIMKQEKAVLAPRDGIITRVVKSANFQQDKKMVPVVEGELILELGAPPRLCEECGDAIQAEDCKFCPHCGCKR